MKIFLSYHEELSRVASLIEDAIRANSDIKFAILQKNAEIIIDLNFSDSVRKNTLHCVLYDHNKLIKSITDEIKESADARRIPADYAKIDKRVSTPETPTVYIKFGRIDYEFDDASWSSAVAEGIISGIEGPSAIEDIKVYVKPQNQKTFYERNFAQEPTRNSDLFKA